MNILQPVSTIMSTELITVNPSDQLTTIKALFNKNDIHHIPVVRHRDVVGIVSMSDFLYFLHGFQEVTAHKPTEDPRLENWKASDIMTHQVVKLEVSDPIRTALEVFKLNKLHALPVMDNGKLAGIVTTYDIIAALAEEPIELEDYQGAQ